MVKAKLPNIKILTEGLRFEDGNNAFRVNHDCPASEGDIAEKPALRGGGQAEPTPGHFVKAKDGFKKSPWVFKGFIKFNGWRVVSTGGTLGGGVGCFGHAQLIYHARTHVNPQSEKSKKKSPPGIFHRTGTLQL